MGGVVHGCWGCFKAHVLTLIAIGFVGVSTSYGACLNMVFGASRKCFVGLMSAGCYSHPDVCSYRTPVLMCLPPPYPSLAKKNGFA